jgi:UrcA family protein
MNRRLLVPPAICSALALGLLTRAEPAMAQQAAGPMEEVTVVAPRLVRHEAGRTSSGSRVELVSLTRHVSAGDLDLTRHADVLELRKRINDTAREACDYLAEMFPFASAQSPDCVNKAVDDAMAQAQKAIDAANK